MKFWIISTSLLGLLICSTNAFAQTQEEIHEEALRLFSVGELQYQGDEFTDAANSFSRAYELEPNTILALNAALSHENAGQFEEALRYYQFLLDLLETAPDRDLQRQAERGIQRINVIFETIEANTIQNGVLIIDITPDNALVFINESLVGTEPIEQEVDPGEYNIRVTLEDHEDYLTTVSIEAGETFRMMIPLVSLIEETPTSENSETITVPGASLVPAYAFYGVTVISGIAGIIFGTQAGNTYEQLESYDPDIYRNENGLDDSINEGKNQAMLSLISYGIAGASLIGGMTYVILRRKPSTTTETIVQILPSWNGCQLSIQF